MDPASVIGIATGVVGLLPVCASGCSFIVGLCKAHGNVQEQMIRVSLQRAVGRLRFQLLGFLPDPSPGIKMYGTEHSLSLSSYCADQADIRDSSLGIHLGYQRRLNFIDYPRHENPVMDQR